MDWQNARIYDLHQTTPLSEVRDLSERAFADLVAAIEAVSEADLARSGVQEWTNGEPLLVLIPGQSCAHYDQHRADLRALTGEKAF